MSDVPQTGPLSEQPPLVILANAGPVNLGPLNGDKGEPGPTGEYNQWNEVNGAAQVLLGRALNEAANGRRVIWFTTARTPEDLDYGQTTYNGIEVNYVPSDFLAVAMNEAHWDVHHQDLDTVPGHEEIVRERGSYDLGQFAVAEMIYERLAGPENRGAEIELNDFHWFGVAPYLLALDGRLSLADLEGARTERDLIQYFVEQRRAETDDEQEAETAAENDVRNYVISGFLHTAFSDPDLYIEALGEETARYFVECMAQVPWHFHSEEWQGRFQAVCERLNVEIKAPGIVEPQRIDPEDFMRKAQTAAVELRMTEVKRLVEFRLAQQGQSLDDVDLMAASGAFGDPKNGTLIILKAFRELWRDPTLKKKPALLIVGKDRRPHVKKYDDHRTDIYDEIEAIEAEFPDAVIIHKAIEENGEVIHEGIDDGLFDTTIAVGRLTRVHVAGALQGGNEVVALENALFKQPGDDPIRQIGFAGAPAVTRIEFVRPEETRVIGEREVAGVTIPVRELEGRGIAPGALVIRNIDKNNTLDEAAHALAAAVKEALGWSLEQAARRQQVIQIAARDGENAIRSAGYRSAATRGHLVATVTSDQALRSRGVDDALVRVGLLDERTGELADEVTTINGPFYDTEFSHAVERATFTAVRATRSGDFETALNANMELAQLWTEASLEDVRNLPDDLTQLSVAHMRDAGFAGDVLTAREQRHAEIQAAHPGDYEYSAATQTLTREIAWQQQRDDERNGLMRSDDVGQKSSYSRTPPPPDPAAEDAHHREVDQGSVTWAALQDASKQGAAITRQAYETGALARALPDPAGRRVARALGEPGEPQEEEKGTRNRSTPEANGGAAAHPQGRRFPRPAQHHAPPGGPQIVKDEGQGSPGGQAAAGVASGDTVASAQHSPASVGGDRLAPKAVPGSPPAHDSPVGDTPGRSRPAPAQTAPDHGQPAGRAENLPPAPGPGQVL